MNRPLQAQALHQQRVPHGRGDEPLSDIAADGLLTVFPTGVGMNRVPASAEPANLSVPHGRGDEPLAEDRLLSATV